MTQNIKKEKKKAPINLETMVYGKIPPHAKELETSVLGILLYEPQRFDLIASILKPEAFYYEAHQHVAEAIWNINERNQRAEIELVAEELKRMEKLESVGGLYFLTSLTIKVVSSANLEIHARIIIQYHMRRLLITYGGNLVINGYEDSIDVFELIDKAETDIMSITEKNIPRSVTKMDKAVMEAIKQIYDWEIDGTGITGIVTPFERLTIITRGFQAPDLIIIGARPGVGKTAMALKIARTAARSGKPGAFFSLEMRTVQLTIRAVSAESRIHMDRLQRGQLEKGHKEILMEKSSELAKLPIYFDDSSSLTLRELGAKLRKLKKENNIQWAIIDYLQLMDGDGSAGNREQEISKISRGLKQLAKRLGIPIFALSQLTRETDKQKSEPQLSNLRESGAIEQDADLVIFLWALEGNQIGIKIAKHRSGRLDRFELTFLNEFQDFEVAGGYRPVSVVDSPRLPYKEDNGDLPF